uniref:Uncharacterized protein n=1 Tax=Ditylenchus dipsaci TaxID=166011 RepID=A0A915CUZ0_9BILA
MFCWSAKEVCEDLKITSKFKTSRILRGPDASTLGGGNHEGYYSDSSESEQERIVEQEAIVPAVRRRPQPAIVQPSVAVLSPQSCPSLRRTASKLKGRRSSDA